MKSILASKKKKKKIIKEKQDIRLYNKSYSLTEIRNPKKIEISQFQLPRDDSFLHKKYKNEKNLIGCTIQNQLFTTQDNNVATLNENAFNTENWEKKVGQYPAYPKKELEIILFENIQEKSKKDNKSSTEYVINQFKEEKLEERKKQSLIKEYFEKEPIYINKSAFSERNEKENNRWKSLQNLHDISVNKDDISIDQVSRYVDSFTSRKMDKSIINCLICFDKIPDSVFMECGHGGISCILFFKILKFVVEVNYFWNV